MNLYFDMDTDLCLEGACDPEETFSGFHTENETVFTQPLCMKVSERHYSE